VVFTQMGLATNSNHLSYNQGMQLPHWMHVSLRIGLVTALILALNLAARPHRLDEAWLHISQSDPADDQAAIAVSLARLAQAQPWRKDLWYRAAQAAWAAESWQLGITCLEQLDPDTWTAADWLSLGDAYQALNQPEKAFQAWERSLALEETVQAHTRLYEVHRLNQDFSRILDSLTALHRLQPADDSLTYQLVIYQAAIQPERALDTLQQAEIKDETTRLQLQTLERKLLSATLEENPAAQFMGAGQALAELGEWDLAAQAFQQAVLVEPGYAEAWAYLGETRQHLNPPQPQAALSDLRQALRLNPKSVPTLSMLALYWQRQGDLARAADLYHTVADLEPDNPTWYAALGGIANAQGELAEAERYYLQAVTLAPQEAVYLRLLAGFYILNQVEVEQKAIPAALQAVQIAPDDPANQAILGQAYLMNDELEKALQVLTQALSLDENYAPAHLYLGTLYLYRGDSGLAQFHLARANEQATDSATKDQAQRMLNTYFP
jgi:tetratricopeptide (TPR) repeat protein